MSENKALAKYKNTYKNCNSYYHEKYNFLDTELKWTRNTTLHFVTLKKLSKTILYSRIILLQVANKHKNFKA